MDKVRTIVFVTSLFSVAACASDPYITHTTIDKERNTKTERVCTHKTAYVPWYAVYAAGLFSFKYGEQCENKETKID